MIPCSITFLVFFVLRMRESRLASGRESRRAQGRKEEEESTGTRTRTYVSEYTHVHEHAHECLGLGLGLNFNPTNQPILTKCGKAIAETKQITLSQL